MVIVWLLRGATMGAALAVWRHAAMLRSYLLLKAMREDRLAVCSQRSNATPHASRHGARLMARRPSYGPAPV